MQPTLSISSGDHDLKFGYQGSHGYQHSQNYSFSHAPAGLRAVFRDGAPDSVNTYNTPTSTPLGLMEHAVYAQDKWAVSRKVTINAGLTFPDGQRRRAGALPGRNRVHQWTVLG